MYSNFLTTGLLSSLNKVTRSDLLYNYKWTVDRGDNPSYVGILDDVKVDKDEGYEVLYLMNAFINKHSKGYTFNKHHINFLEKLIHDKPSSMVYRTEIMKYLEGYLPKQ